MKKDILLARLDKDGWFRCAECGHKLGRMRGYWPVVRSTPALEVKCHSCKRLNNIMMGGKNREDI